MFKSGTTQLSLVNISKFSRIKPPIKWPGGKFREFQYIEHLIPDFDRYIEPFFGGGAVYFKLQPKKAIINDFNSDLVDFYRFIKGDYDTHSFSDELNKYVTNWEKIPLYVSVFEDNFINLYMNYKKGHVSNEQLPQVVINELNNHIADFNGLFSTDFCLDADNLLSKITANLISKIRRIKELEIAKGTISREDLEKNIETAFRSGFYMHFRDVLNLADRKYKVSLPKKIANYYFIREFCYGSMFRFNSDGDFNIPYGGIAYNRKDFRKKVDALFDPDFRNLFQKTTILNSDFEEVFRSYKFSSNDFIFLDPPYDSEFSDYENQEFNHDDHERLSNCLHATNAKFLMLIKNTPFIYQLYSKNNFKIESFEKRYLYNVKGRNNQEAEHLIIYNY